jgi:hypothetical protein
MHLALFHMNNIWTLFGSCAGLLTFTVYVGAQVSTDAEMNRMRLVLFDIKSRIFGPYLVIKNDLSHLQNGLSSWFFLFEVVAKCVSGYIVGWDR